MTILKSILTTFKQVVFLKAAEAESNRRVKLVQIPNSHWITENSGELH